MASRRCGRSCDTFHRDAIDWLCRWDAKYRWRAFRRRGWLLNGVQGITDLITLETLINVDFADA